MDALIAAWAEKVPRSDRRFGSEQQSDIQYDQIWEYQRKAQDRQFSVRNLGGGVFCVEGKAVERMVIQTEWDNEEAVDYLQRRLERMGVEKALIAAGARTGDEIRILARAFAFESVQDGYGSGKIDIEVPASMLQNRGRTRDGRG